MRADTNGSRGGAAPARSRWRRRLQHSVAALIGGALVAALPGFAAAQSRALEPPPDFGGVILVTALGLGALFLVATIGYLYRRERGLRWDFQKPDSVEHHD